MNKIKCLYVMIDNVLIVTNDDKVFTSGNNSYGVLGFGDNKKVEQ